ncbi:MAG TPA: hypothetical protein PKI11_08740 [Candidatus Hydrogenedentes bacterium]|nr:hypothetical protein [Candidatus Hydrogenedentota bacterium]HNT89679.1 hypothetical protein [Candidatus Hydrogenedentota bacterium]
MLKSLEAVIDENGKVRLVEPVTLPHACRAIVTIIEDSSAVETALLSEQSLARDWSRPEEDVAWSHLQQAQ